MKNREFAGRHYETGTIANILLARGDINPITKKPYDEAFVLGASGGIAFGYFVFEYKGYLPHIALLTRNTFHPFERALDNLGIRRELRETTNEAKGEENLRRELDMGNIVVVWADAFSLPYFGFENHEMYGMRPLLVVAQEGDDFLAVDGTKRPFPMSRAEMAKSRGRVKKDRYRTMIVESVNSDPMLLQSATETAVALFLDKPPAGSPNNFGATGMRFMAKMLADEKNAKSWATTFQPGPRLCQALAGTIGQPGIWDWICTWGTDSAADRATYSQFLRDLGRNEAASMFEKSAPLWARLADQALSDQVPQLKTLKGLKAEYKRIWHEQGRESDAERAMLREKMKSLVHDLEAPERLDPFTREIQSGMALILTEIVDIEEQAFRSLL